MQPLSKAAYRSDFIFVKNTEASPQRALILGPFATQASMLPLDHGDLIQHKRVIFLEMLYLC